MTYTVPRHAALAFGAAALVSLSSLSAARADSSSGPAPTPAVTAPAHPTSAPAPTPTSTAAAPSLSEPAPTPTWAEAGPSGTRTAQRQPVRRYSRHHSAHYAYAKERRSYSSNPVASAATGVAGGVADLGSIAAYPFYCFPNYGSCSVRMPYRF